MSTVDKNTNIKDYHPIPPFDECWFDAVPRDVPIELIEFGVHPDDECECECRYEGRPCYCEEVPEDKWVITYRSVMCLRDLRVRGGAVLPTWFNEDNTRWHRAGRNSCTHWKVK